MDTYGQYFTKRSQNPKITSLNFSKTKTFFNFQMYQYIIDIFLLEAFTIPNLYMQENLLFLATSIFWQTEDTFSPFVVCNQLDFAV